MWTSSGLFKVHLILRREGIPLRTESYHLCEGFLANEQLMSLRGDLRDPKVTVSLAHYFQPHRHYTFTFKIFSLFLSGTWLKTTFYVPTLSYMVC